MIRRPPRSTPFPTRRSSDLNTTTAENFYTSYIANDRDFRQTITAAYSQADIRLTSKLQLRLGVRMEQTKNALTEFDRSEEHTSELQSQSNLVCRLLLEKKKT